MRSFFSVVSIFFQNMEQWFVILPYTTCWKIFFEEIVKCLPLIDLPPKKRLNPLRQNLQNFFIVHPMIEYFNKMRRVKWEIPKYDLSKIRKLEQ